ncbi:MAG: 3-dehydroquinate synthase [Verrucomicrobiota bacterium]|nr:3-dehydroquinate synthase [Verrucomicrobiota bacterium]
MTSILFQMVNVPVALGSRSYSIKIGSGLLPQTGSFCAELNLVGKCAIVTDSAVGPLYGEVVAGSLRGAGFDPFIITVPAGESSKSLKSVEDCYNQLAAHRVERKSFIIALGGGVVGDLAGFVAATYLRGIPFVQVPTTLLAQVDSSVGGKVGVNLMAGKNLVGAFHQPQLVVCDLDTFGTLPQREFRAGLSEVIKYGIIHDRSLFSLLENEAAAVLERSPELLAKLVARSCEIKAEVVSRDETETSVRAILNFGHTIGHGLEAISGYGVYLHGEAIAIGQIAAARISALKTGLKENELKRIEAIFASYGLPTGVRLKEDKKEKLLAAMKLDKKVSSGVIKFVLAKSIGEVEYGQPVEEAWLSERMDSLIA